MQDNIEVKTQKDFFNLKCIKYKRIANAAGSLITFSNQKQKSKNSSIIEFPMIENTMEKEKRNSTVLILEKKIIQEEIAKKNNQRQSRSMAKHSEQNRRKKVDECMNMLGLDVIRIKCLNQQNKEDTIRQNNFRKISKISEKMSEIKMEKQFSKELTQRKRTETIQKDDISKFQVTDSFILMNKRKSTNSMSPYKIRKISIDYGEDQRQKVFNNTIGSKINYPRKKQYLYKKLEGSQNKSKQQFGQVYERRIRSYLDFLFKVQISYNFVSNLDLKVQQLSSRPKKLKAYVGPGNNGSMIKGILKRRFWWTVVEQKTQDCVFVWTQIKINQIFKNQRKKPFQKPEYKKIQPSISGQSSVKSPSKKKKMAQIVKKSEKQNKFFQNNQNYNVKLLNSKDQIVYKKAHQSISQRQRDLSYEQKKPYIQKVLNPRFQISDLIHNHLANNFYLGNKKALFHNLKEYYNLIKENPFDYIPFTFHIKNGMKDPQYIKFCQYHKRRNKLIKKQEKQEEQGYEKKNKTRNIWIVKPGQNSNQGRGITVIDEVYELNMIMKQANSKNNKKPQTSSTNTSLSNHDPSNQNDSNQKNTFIVQMYIDRPFLYNNRKFDIRHYMLITNFFGITRAYWYQEGYIRTSSYEFNIHSFQPQIHLTNDAVQKNFPDYHKFQPFNKISYQEFQRYLDLNLSNKKHDFKVEILPQMKKMATDAAKSVFTKICPQNPMNNFEIFGLDFMIDKNFRPWLIEINTNPCLDCACPLLDTIIPYMVEQSFKLSLDIAYPPPHHYPSTYRHFAPLINLENFKYELIFDSQVQGDALTTLYKSVKGNLIDEIGEIQEDQTFKDEGKQIKLDDFT